MFETIFFVINATLSTTGSASSIYSIVCRKTHEKTVINQLKSIRDDVAYNRQQIEQNKINSDIVFNNFNKKSPIKSKYVIEGNSIPKLSNSDIDKIIKDGDFKPIENTDEESKFIILKDKELLCSNKTNALATIMPKVSHTITLKYAIYSNSFSNDKKINFLILDSEQSKHENVFTSTIGINKKIYFKLEYDDSEEYFETELLIPVNYHKAFVIKLFRERSKFNIKIILNDKIVALFSNY